MMEIFMTGVFWILGVIFVVFLLTVKFPTGRFRIVEYNDCYLAELEYRQCFVKVYRAYGVYHRVQTWTQWTIRPFYYKHQLMQELIDLNLVCINPDFLLKRDT